MLNPAFGGSQIDMRPDGIDMLVGILVDEPALLEVAVAAVLDQTSQVVAIYSFPGGMDIEGSEEHLLLSGRVLLSLPAGDHDGVDGLG
jgi:hypothetical protein